MLLNSLNKIPSDFKKYIIENIESGASRKIFYRLKKDNISLIFIDFVSDKLEYQNYLIIYKLLKDINISIPNIIQKNDSKLIIICEDFGDLRFDKILEKYSLKEILHYAVDSLIIIKNSISYNKKLLLPIYNFEIFKNEITEILDYYFPYIGKKKEIFDDEFFSIWSEVYNQIDFQFKYFSHKDFNINNLILLPQRKNHYKCGIIDFQDGFWGESCWDLFSLLEDSRVYFTDEFNEYFIEYFYKLTTLDISLDNFKMKYNFFNISRQTRLLGRWIKLSKEKKDQNYLNFIPVTKKRLIKSLNLFNNKKLENFYNKHILNL